MTKSSHPMGQQNHEWVPTTCLTCRGTGIAPCSDGRTPCGFCEGGQLTEEMRARIDHVWGPVLRRKGIWRIYRVGEDRPVTVAGYLSEESAWRQIEEWQRRRDKGGRPDLQLDLDQLEVRCVP